MYTIASFYLYFLCILDNNLDQTSNTRRFNVVIKV